MLIHTANFAIHQSAGYVLTAIGYRLTVASVNRAAINMNIVAYVHQRNVSHVSPDILLRMENAFHVERSMTTAAYVVLILAMRVMMGIIPQVLGVCRAQVVVGLRGTVISVRESICARSVKWVTT